MRAISLVLMAMFAVGCQQKSEEQKLVKAASPVKSWAASLSFAGELWIRNQVPASLVENSIKSARKAIAKTETQLEKSKAAEKVRASVDHALEEAKASCSTLEHAIETADKRTTAREVTRFNRVYNDLDSLEKEWE